MTESLPLDDQLGQFTGTLIKIAKGRDDCGRPISGQAAQAYARIALKNAEITWGDYQGAKAAENG